MWALRCVHEAQSHKENSFITLTYNDEFIPSDGSLDKRHFQLFMKKLREELSPKRIRFYHCGEYGPKLARPHYHAILFGHQFTDLKLHSDRKGTRLYRSATLARIWGKGFVTVGDVNINSAGYVARYCMKKITGEQADYHYLTVDPHTGEILGNLQPEYNTMSRKPGIARDWYETYSSDVYPSDGIFHKGQTHRPPRYYDSMFESTNPVEWETVKRARKVRAHAKREDSTPERLAVRETCKNLQLNHLKRTYENDET